MSVEVIRTVAQMRETARGIRAQGLRLGLVPTMGYLHEGHVSLIRRARRFSDCVVVSLFVNPTQFGPNEDFAAYPRDFDRDLGMIRGAGAQYVFAPDVAEMYPTGFSTTVTVDGVARPLEGERRPGHFGGVATVVAKLFGATQPHVAVFGQKDAQQVAVIKRMTADLNLDVQVVVAPTVREADGLARSSRNVYLKAEERRQATVLFAALQEGRRAILGGERDLRVVTRRMERLIRTRPLARVDYVAVVDPKRFETPDTLSGEALLLLAVHFGKARLIDNMPVENLTVGSLS